MEKAPAPKCMPAHQDILVMPQGAMFLVETGRVVVLPMQPKSSAPFHSPDYASKHFQRSFELRPLQNFEVLLHRILKAFPEAEYHRELILRLCGYGKSRLLNALDRIFSSR